MREWILRRQHQDIKHATHILHSELIGSSSKQIMRGNRGGKNEQSDSSEDGKQHNLKGQNQYGYKRVNSHGTLADMEGRNQSLK